VSLFSYKNIETCVVVVERGACEVQSEVCKGKREIEFPSQGEFFFRHTQ
jgi:hypothetical protein